MASKPGTQATADANAAVLAALPFEDDTDFDDANRGFVAAGSGQITNATGTVVWDLDKWGFLEGYAPPQRQPEPLAPRPPQRDRRPPGGRRRRLPGARLRPVRRELPADRLRLDRRRPAHQ